jgi:two-component system response regulator HydG
MLYGDGMIEGLLRKLKSKQRIVGAAVGSGMAAAAAEEGGADLLMVLSAGFFRSQGCSSMAALLPYADANELTCRIAFHHILPRIRRTPLFLGVCAQDPRLSMDSFFREIRSHGIAGITNFPSVGFLDGIYREALEENGMGIAREIEVLKRAKEAGLVTIGFCFNSREALAMSQQGVDILNLDLGFAEWRDVETAEHYTALDRAVDLINTVAGDLEKKGHAPYLTVFGGPVVLPQDAEQVFQRARVHGYIGGSTVERFPAATTITHTVREFRQAVSRSQEGRLGAITSVSPRMKDVLEKIRVVAQSDAPVLILGPSGAGKELVAREIHRLSRRCGQPLVCWNCGATTESLAMSELFGHEKGAFTGADRVRLGRFEVATGATLFMDEVADLPLAVQASLLRVIQEQEIVRVGGQQPIPVDVRLVAASNKDFRELIPSGKFRQDLYYRLSTVVLQIPPLRERPEDIPILIHEFLQEFSRIYACPIPSIPGPVMDRLMRHAWPGNIRELRSVIERGFILGRGAPFQSAWIDDLLLIDARLDSAVTGGPGVPQESRAEKKKRVHSVLAEVGGNKAEAARRLGVTRKTIYEWLGKGAHRQS